MECGRGGAANIVRRHIKLWMCELGLCTRMHYDCYDTMTGCTGFNLDLWAGLGVKRKKCRAAPLEPLMDNFQCAHLAKEVNVLLEMFGR